MSPSSGSRKILLTVALILAGCSSKSDTGQGLVPNPDAAFGRTLAKRDASPDRAIHDASLDGARADASDAAVDAPVTDPTKDALGDVGDAAIVTPGITIEVDNRSLVPPRDGGVAAPLLVPSTYSPSPFVTVTVVSRSGDLKLDEISKVTATILDPLASAPFSTTTLAKTESAITPETNTTRYIFSEVPLDLSKLTSGSYNVVFTVTTVGGTTEHATVVISVDAGPILNVKLPVDKAFYKGSAPIEVEATQVSFAVSQVTMALGQGEPKPLLAMGGGVYKGNIDFASFVPELEGPQLVTFRAINENGTISTVQRSFTSDNTGPVISATSPGLGAMVGNVITIKATVDDLAGVDDTSVIAVVGNGNQNFEVVLTPRGNKLYSVFFDTTKLPDYTLFPTLSFRARDKLGNESTTSYMLTLDNQPPLLDLDPAYIRVSRITAGQTVCSWPFDPVGPDAVDDGDLVPQLFDVRARIEDEGNKPLTGDSDAELIGGIDPATVKLFVLGNASHPLVVDTSDPPDGYCDDLNPELVPTTKPQTDLDAQVLDMVPLPPQGGGDFTLNPDSSCSIPTLTDPKIPDPFCKTTENPYKALWMQDDPRAHSANMTIAISYTSKKSAAIYTLGPIVGDGSQCAGRQFDSSNNLKNGWACLAAKASDFLGNTQVSRPLRVCVVADPTKKGCADFQPLVRLQASKTLEIHTSAPLLNGSGVPLPAGTDVLLTGVTSDPAVNRVWKVDPLDTAGTRFSLRGASGYKPKVCACETPACTRPSVVNCMSLYVPTTPTPGQPVTFETIAEHGLPNGYTVMIVGNTEQAGLEGVPWKVTVIDATHFSLDGSVATAPLPPGGSVFAVTEKMPDCTGTLTKRGTDAGRPVVDSTKPCKSWTRKDSFIRH